MIKDRNDRDLTFLTLEAEEIKMRGQECTKELYKKDLNDPDNHDSIIAHREPDTLENKASGGDGIPAKLFQILKDDAVKVLHSICQQTENSVVVKGLEKVSFHCNTKLP